MVVSSNIVQVDDTRLSSMSAIFASSSIKSTNRFLFLQWPLLYIQLHLMVIKRSSVTNLIKFGGVVFACSNTIQITVIHVGNFLLYRKNEGSDKRGPDN